MKKYIKEELWSNIKAIRAIGQTGDINFVPKAGEADIDIFVFGDIGS